ncbi:MAG: glycosyltransferase family 4 protein [Planctomycetes bacterium]|nr:glycosyltransferase family 4 protein [Planctomycetota bacterium]
MRILHLFSDWKWTGPAEPAVQMSAGLNAKGIEVFFACQRPPANARQSILQKLSGAKFHVITDFNLAKGLKPLKGISDIKAIRKFIRDRHIDIVHTHTDHDHFIGGTAARGTEARIVRTNHKGVPFRTNIAARYLINKLTDAYTTFTETGLIADNKNYPGREDFFYKLNPSIDIGRFNAEGNCGNARKEFGISANAAVAGIVARVQRHRKFDILFKAFKTALKDMPEMRLMIIGRGTHINELAVEPAKNMGLEHAVIFTGYRDVDYLSVLNTFDFKVFLVPGSDGTCRAVREAMAMGKPVIASNNGILPEMVENEKTGLVVKDTPEDLAEAMVKLAKNPELRQRLGRNALIKANAEYNPQIQITQMFDVYIRTLK